MLSRFCLYAFLGLALFYLYELLLFPQVYLRPLAPLLFYVALKYSLSLSFTLAIILGLLQDSYALTPFGVHLLSSLILVATARLVRQRFLLKSPWSLIPAMLMGLLLQELGVRLILTLLGSRTAFMENLSWPRGVELLVTAVLTPIFFALIRALENLLRQLGRSPRRASASR